MKYTKKFIFLLLIAMLVALIAVTFVACDENDDGALTREEKQAIYDELTQKELKLVDDIIGSNSVNLSFYSIFKFGTTYESMGGSISYRQDPVYLCISGDAFDDQLNGRYIIEEDDVVYYYSPLRDVSVLGEYKKHIKREKIEQDISIDIWEYIPEDFDYSALQQEVDIDLVNITKESETQYSISIPCEKALSEQDINMLKEAFEGSGLDVNKILNANAILQTTIEGGCYSAKFSIEVNFDYQGHDIPFKMEIAVTLDNKDVDVPNLAGNSVIVEENEIGTFVREYNGTIENFDTDYVDFALMELKEGKQILYDRSGYGLGEVKIYDLNGTYRDDYNVLDTVNGFVCGLKDVKEAGLYYVSVENAKNGIHAEEYDYITEIDVNKPIDIIDLSDSDNAMVFGQVEGPHDYEYYQIVSSTPKVVTFELAEREDTKGSYAIVQMMTEGGLNNINYAEYFYLEPNVPINFYVTADRCTNYKVEFSTIQGGSSSDWDSMNELNLDWNSDITAYGRLIGASYYKFTLEYARKITTYTGISRYYWEWEDDGLILELYTRDGQRIENINEYLEPGDYYFKVYNDKYPICVGNFYARD